MRFAAPQVHSQRRPDGTTILRSSQLLGDCDRAVGDWLVRWAARAPERSFLAERAGEGWRTITYGETLDTTRRIGQSLLSRGLTSSTPVAILSDNSVNHALLALGAMHAGIPVAPISPAYSLLSKDHANPRPSRPSSTASRARASHRMLCSNQHSWAQAWPFLNDSPPIM